MGPRAMRERTKMTSMSPAMMSACEAPVSFAPQGVLIDDLHAACTGEDDHTAMFEVRQRPADGLDR